MKFLSFVLVLAVTLSSFVVETDAGRRRKRGSRCGSVPAALRGGAEKQKQQNLAADRHALSRIKNAEQLERFIKMGGPKRLVPVSDTAAYELDPDLGSQDPSRQSLYRHARVWTKAFLDRELADGHAATGDRFKITSLVRPRDYQTMLRRLNKAAIVGKAWWKRSSHMTGATVDISFEGLSANGKAWLRKRLAKLQAQGKIIAVEESCNGHFHVMVLPTYDKMKVKAKVKSKRRKGGRTR